GQDTLVLDRPVDWAKDDHIVVTTTDYLPGHSEEFIIDTVSADKKAITVTKTAEYTHNGDVFPLDAVPDRLGLDIHVNGQPAAETRAAVALLTRSIRIVSAGDDFGDPFPEPDVLVDSTEEPGTGKKHPYYFGGHTVIRQGVEAVQIQGVEFKQMGQGGRMGHYPIHFHLTRKAPPNTFVKDSSINESMTRWVVLHGAQNITLARNVGYKSIGHGFYLEDGTEINNKLHSNIGIFARAAVDNVQNPRQVPGILASPPELTPVPGSGEPDFREADLVPYHSDYDHPTVFWIMNGWNDFVGNMAVGAGTCGVCYWLVSGANSGPSRPMKWESYASMQEGLDRAGTTPLRTFRGNYCSTAMNSFNTVSNTTACLGVDIPIDINNGLPLFDVLTHVDNPLTPARLLDLGKPRENPKVLPTPNPVAANYYPIVDAGGGRFATRCEGDEADCSQVKKCANGDGLANCEITFIDHYTSAFHWTETNFAAIWLRPQWYLVANSVLSDVQNGGLTFVTGGDYTNASTIEGHWALARKNVFIGHTQPANPFASNGGPVNPMTGLECDTTAGNHCLLEDQGISFPLSNFGVNQRLFNIYDGPAYEDANAYLDIKKTELNDCTPGTGPNHVCFDSDWMYGRAVGIPQVTKTEGDAKIGTCYLPNAAIGWKQPNGFYYPPAFHSRNLFFDNVDIRHFVIEPLFQEGTFKTDATKVEAGYCTRNDALFEGFTDIDRQTELNDDDGSLTGLVNTVIVNEDPFFNAPVEALECASDGTAKVSPYDYVSTVVYPGENARKDAGFWSVNCNNQNCYGVPLYRQLLTADETDAPSIRMMGMGISQRNSLTVNQGVYYIDTTVSADDQRASGAGNINAFKKNETYYVFLLYAKPSTRQTYQMYVGAHSNFDPLTDVNLTRATISSSPLVFDDDGDWPDDSWDRKYNANTGILEVTMDLGSFEESFNDARQHSCQPASFCEWKADEDNQSGSCGCADGNSSGLSMDDCNAVCEWATKDLDCPAGGCYGFAVTLPAEFKTLSDAERTALQINPSPATNSFPASWDVKWQLATPDLAGDDCKNPDGTEGNTKNTYITGTALSERIFGTEGDDIIEGFGGDDQIIGLDGNDWISGGTGNDVLLGGEGDDELHGDDGADLIQGDDGDDLMFGGAGDDILSGGAGADLLLGNAGDDLLQGDAGNDMLFGDEGEDVLIGGAGDDALLGGAGEDLINAGTGNDTCAAVAPASSCETAF
ncbi:MAG: hypothetical protein KDJ99_27310, partial [Candidatus Competibacteraceae bacterium]|nr:hypothetical protein [Candidatus Competibacteraceae bacterium]